MKSTSIEKYSYGLIQFRGTDICMDVHCKCGCHSHIDGCFVYFLECPECGVIYELNGRIELIERKKIDIDVDVKKPCLIN